MKIFLICDNHDTLTGMRLAGVDGIVLHDREEVIRELKKHCEALDTGILLITESLEKKVMEEVRQIKLSQKLPIIIEIPDRHGSRRPSDYFTKFIREAIGLKI
ncbi:MAG: ATP synthase subunit F [Thermoanaerobacterales bacterium]|nr:ATP synthase subunit F [Thermoanaerobacterales bacterium]